MMYALVVAVCGLVPNSTPMQSGNCALSYHPSIFYTEEICKETLVAVGVPEVSEAISRVPHAYIAEAKCLPLGEAPSL